MKWYPAGEYYKPLQESDSYNSNGMSCGFLDVAQLATSSPKEIITSQPTWSPGLVFHLLSRTEGPKVFYPPDLLPLVTRKAFAAKKLILSFSGRFTHWKRVNGMSWKKTQKISGENMQIDTHPVTLYSPSHPTTKNSQHMIIWPLFSWYRYRLQVGFYLQRRNPAHPC